MSIQSATNMFLYTATAANEARKHAKEAAQREAYGDLLGGTPDLFAPRDLRKAEYANARMKQQRIALTQQQAVYPNYMSRER